MNTSKGLSSNSICSFIAEPPAPTVRQAMNGNLLYPILSTAKPWIYELEVKYPEIDNDHLIEVKIVGEGFEDILLEPKPGDKANGFVVFELTEAIIALFIDGDGYITYWVTSGSVSVQSITLVLTVQRIKDSDQPIPAMPQAKDKVLDLREIRELIRCTLGAIPFASTNMRVWFDLQGLDGSSTPITHHLLQGEKLDGNQVTKGLDLTVDRDFLHLFQDYAGLTLVIYVSYKGLNDKNLATELSRDTYQIRQILQARFEEQDFETEPLSLISAGGSITVNHMKIDLLSGSNGVAGIDTFAYALPGMRVGKSIAVCKNIHSNIDQQQLLITFDESLTRLKFAITWVHFYLRAELFDDQGNLIDDLTLTQWSNVWADFSSAAGIKTMKLYCRDYSFLDFFHMWIKP